VKWLFSELFAISGAKGPCQAADSLFLIGGGEEPYTAPGEAELCLFANDIPSRYGNNEGCVTVTVTQVDWQ
jgi:hypothetical protein